MCGTKDNFVVEYYTDEFGFFQNRNIYLPYIILEWSLNEIFFVAWSVPTLFWTWSILDHSDQHDILIY